MMGTAGKGNGKTSFWAGGSAARTGPIKARPAPIPNKPRRELCIAMPLFLKEGQLKSLQNQWRFNLLLLRTPVEMKNILY
jgi:hypothetical protein